MQNIEYIKEKLYTLRVNLTINTFSYGTYSAILS